MGKVDQGVFTYWMLAHHFRRPLAYIGFGGSGKQVRDLLHVDDLVELVELQLSDPGSLDGCRRQRRRRPRRLCLLLELTELCAEITGNVVDVSAAPEDRPGRHPVVRLRLHAADRPDRVAAAPTVRGILADMHEWIATTSTSCGPALAID